jgi:DNA-binding LacI/PurR family transcriptional regulator
MQTLFDRLRAEDPQAMPPRHIHLVPQLVVRRSCGAAPEPSA